MICEINWSDQLQNLDTFQSWEFFKKVLTDIVEKCIPLKHRRSSNKPLWMNRNIMRTIRKKRRLWNHFKTTKTHCDYSAYLAVQKSVAKIIRSAKRKLEQKLAKNFKKNPRPFYSHLNKNLKSRSQIGPLKNDNDELVSDNEGMANIFNMFFASVFTEENTHKLPSPPTVCNGQLLSAITIDTDDIIKKVEKLKDGSAPGPDKFGPRILKNLKDELALPLCILFKKSLTRGEVPDDWKCGNITPVFKKGSRSCASNYRPISLTSVICKLLESLLLDGITSHLASQSLLKLSQHGFMQHRSCLTNLLEFLEKVTSLLDEGHNVDVFYLDFSKAFDRVPHECLLLKLKSHGIVGNILSWVRFAILENVQRRAVNAVSRLNGTYEDKLSALNLPSLADRRKRGDMLKTYKVLKEIDNVDPNTFFNLSANLHSYPTRQAAYFNNTTRKVTSSLGLSERPCRLELRRNFFSNRVVPMWNSLPAEIQNSSSVLNFKKGYDSFV